MESIGDEASRSGEPHELICRIELLEQTVGDLQKQVSDLETALTNARMIGAAVGVVMVIRHLPYEEAWAALRIASQSSHRKVRDVAQTVILTGEFAVNEDQVRPRTQTARSRRGSTSRSEEQTNGPITPATS